MVSLTRTVIIIIIIMITTIIIVISVIIIILIITILIRRNISIYSKCISIKIDKHLFQTLQLREHSLVCGLF